MWSRLCGEAAFRLRRTVATHMDSSFSLHRDLVRVYTKPRGVQTPDYTAPVVLKRSKSTVEDFCNAIHREILKQLR